MTTATTTVGTSNTCMRRFLDDLTTPRLLILKALYFLLLGGVVLLWPQFTIHQEALGLTHYQTGMCSAVVSGVGIFVPFFSGFLGDKMGNYKVLLSMVTMLVGVVAILFIFIPSAKTTTTTTTNTTNTSLISPLPAVDEDQLKITFWSYLAVRVAYGTLQAVSYTLFDAAVMAEVQAAGVDYGFQRAWGTLAVIGASFLSGHLVQLTGGYSALFYLSAALQWVSAIFMLFLALDFKPPAVSLTRHILVFAANIEVLLFFAALLASGIFFGFLETFMYRYLVSLGASSVLVGLTVTVGAPFELVLTLLASLLVPRVGHVTIIAFGILAHAIRLLGFSALVDPWWVIPLEVLESVTNGLLSTVAVMYCTVLFPLEAIASFRGIFAVVYFGVGQLLGAMVGAWLRERLGDRGTFRTLAWVALACSFTYGASYLALKLWRAKGSERRGERRNSTRRRSSSVRENHSLPPSHRHSFHHHHHHPSSHPQDHHTPHSQDHPHSPHPHYHHHSPHPHDHHVSHSKHRPSTHSHPPSYYPHYLPSHLSHHHHHHHHPSSHSYPRHHRHHPLTPQHPSPPTPHSLSTLEMKLKGIDNPALEGDDDT